MKKPGPHTCINWCLAFLSDEADAERVEWMKHNKVPEAKCTQYMMDTAWSRHKWIRQKRDDGSRRSVREILDRYPRLLEDGNVSCFFILLTIAFIFSDLM